MSFTTIEDSELVNLGVTGLPDTPELSTEAMQAQFDEYPQFLKDKFKTHITELEANTAAGNIGATVPEQLTGVTTEKVQDILNGLAGMQSTHAARTDNPHSVTKAQVGLGDVPNVTTDNQTPTVSEAAEYANLAEGDTLAVIVGKIKKAISTLTSHMANTSNPHSVTKAQVGLGNCDNTADLSKPISTATQTALDGKAPTSHASANTTYGIGTGSNYGHVKLSDTYNPETPGEASDGIAASQKAVKDLFSRTLEEIQQAGWGDMLRTVYDPDKDGVIGLAQGGTGQTTAQETVNALADATADKKSATLADADEILVEQTASNVRTWGRTTLAKVWDYIKTKIGISAQGSTGKYLDEQGNFTTPPNTTYTGATLETNAAQTGSGSTVTNSIAANTSMDSSIGTLLNNDVALNTNKAEKTDITDIKCTGSTNDTGATITSGTFFYKGTTLVKAKVDIADGATLTENTNYESAEVGGELTSIKSSLANENRLSTTRVNMGVTDSTKTYTCPSDGCIWVSNLDAEPTVSVALFINSIPRAHLNKYTFSMSFIVKKGDVISTNVSFSDGGWFYSQA